MKKKMFVLVGIVSFCLIMIGVLGFTYAFFTASVGGNDRASSTIVETAELKLVFSDTQKIEMNEALPGQSVTKTFTVENTSDIELEYTIDIIDVINEFRNDDLVYSLTSTNGGATATKKALPTSEGTLEIATIAAGVTQTYTITVFKELENDENLNTGAVFSGKLQIISKKYSNNKPTLTEKMLAAETAQSDINIDYSYTSEGCSLQDPSGCKNFNETQITNGLYYTEDSTEGNERVYFYRGAVTNNYVVFGDYCWRIVRTVEDGSVRLRYGGAATQSYTCSQTGNAVSVGTSQYYTSYDNKGYVDYKTSSVRKLLENWYRDNLVSNTELTNLIEDTPYCNDASERITTTDLNYQEKIDVYFGAYDRLTAGGTNSYNPQYKCSSSSYGYTVAKGDLTYPIALLTADEIAYAGLSNNALCSSNYLNTGETYWTMSPYILSGLGGRNMTYMFRVDEYGSPSIALLNAESAVVPVISLKAEAKVESGNGLYNDPYVILTE